MPFLALLRLLPGIGRLIMFVTTWLSKRTWGKWLMFYAAGSLGLWIQKLLTFGGLVLVSNEVFAPQLRDLIAGPMLGMPEPFPQLLAMTKIDQALTVLLSATVVQAISKVKISRRPDAPGWTTSPGAS